MKKLNLFVLVAAVSAAVLFTATPARSAGTTHHTKTATAATNAATLSDLAGIVTTEALTTAGLASYTLTLTNTYVTTASLVHATVANGTNTQGTPAIGTITPGAGSVVIVVYNLHATQALNGTLVIRFDIAK